ncbi:hypothetical protein L6R29_05020 [Myxococcota bacterium]|nr:hypothetical protein [Myxococcota bacterium]
MHAPSPKEGIRLFFLAFLTLYLELALIRFTSAEVLYLGYFSNFILIAVFLGIGLGFLSFHREWTFFQYVPQLLLLLVAFVVTTHIDATYLREHIGQLFFGHRETPFDLPLWFCLPFLFLLVVLIFFGIAQETARVFHLFRPLTSYSIDIAGSLAGIAAFTLQSALARPPYEWFLFAALLLLLFRPKHLHWFNSFVMGAGLILIVFASSPKHFTRWSPYQRIEVWEMKSPAKGYHLSANGIGHQTMQPVGTKEAFYFFPYKKLPQFHPTQRYENALIIGSGSGTDVSYALKHGVRSIDAVEIDPEILAAGKQFHPNRPYADQRVRTFVTDGRAFMEKSTTTYDLILFALPDSLASLSNFANIRLESFLFTVNSFQQAKQRLKPNGTLVLYNYYRKRWLIIKLAKMLEQVFGHPPVVVHYGSGLAALAIGPTLQGKPIPPKRVDLATDDWPFLYMQYATLPPVYLLIMFMFVAFGVFGVWLCGEAKPSQAKEYMPFALMGAAFLLLETKSIVQFSLLFGATWLVNSLVFFAILSSVLFANFIVYKISIKRSSLLFLLLFSSLLLQYFLPTETLLAIQQFELRYVFASLLFFAPIFFANLIFGYFFKDTKVGPLAFGWNIIGTMIGGAFEYSSLLFGYKTLTLWVIALYLACFVWLFYHPAPPAQQADATS